MKVSVLVPVYNLHEYIEACLISLLTQDIKDEFEVIVCDDGSNDGTKHILRSMENRFDSLVCVYKKENQGLAKNMQTLINLARGDYIAYMDGDDLALPKKLKIQAEYLDENADCDMVFHESQVFNSATNENIKLFSESYYNWHHIPIRSGISDLIRYGTYMHSGSVMFRNHSHLSETILSECQLVCDYPFYLMNAGYLSANIDFLPIVLGKYRLHADSFSFRTGSDTKRRIQSANEMIAAVRACSRFGVSERVIEQGVKQHQFAAALHFLRNNETQLFTEYINLSVDTPGFFNAKHELSWSFRQDPGKLKILLFEDQ